MSLVKRTNYPVMPDLFDDLFSRDLWNWGLKNNSTTGTNIPAVNIKENQENFEVEMAAPGMNKEDFKVQLDGNMLTINSEKRSEQSEDSQENYTRKEFSYQSFNRAFQLPKEVVDIDQIQAKYENGVLRLLIPKKKKQNQNHQE